MYETVCTQNRHKNHRQKQQIRIGFNLKTLRFTITCCGHTTGLHFIETVEKLLSFAAKINSKRQKLFDVTIDIMGKHNILGDCISNIAMMVFRKKSDIKMQAFVAMCSLAEIGFCRCITRTKALA